MNPDFRHRPGAATSPLRSVSGRAVCASAVSRLLCAGAALLILWAGVFWAMA